MLSPSAREEKGIHTTLQSFAPDSLISGAICPELCRLAQTCIDIDHPNRPLTWRVCRGDHWKLLRNFWAPMFFTGRCPLSVFGSACISCRHDLVRPSSDCMWCVCMPVQQSPSHVCCPTQEAIWAVLCWHLPVLSCMHGCKPQYWLHQSGGSFGQPAWGTGNATCQSAADHAAIPLLFWGAPSELSLCHAAWKGMS